MSTLAIQTTDWTRETLAELVRTLYECVLARAPSADEIDSKLEGYFSGRSTLAGLIEDFLQAEEFPAERARYYWTQERATVFVDSLYRAALGRPLDDEGSAYFVAHLAAGRILAQDVVARLLAGDEFKSVSFSRVWHGATSNYRLDLSATEDQLRSLWETTARYWRRAGDKPEEVYFSVLASPGFQRALEADDLDKFYSSGAEFVDFVWSRILEREEKRTGDGLFATLLRGRKPSFRRALDFGAGVGRLSYWAADKCDEVYAVDFSAGHLGFLRENLQRFSPAKAAKVRTQHLQTLDDLERLPRDIDVVFSYITLQHNTPPVMARTVERLLGTLRPGGYAFLHVPVHHPFYRFSVDDYLKSSGSGQHMEMHIIPREELRLLARRNGCEMVDSFGFGGTVGVYSEVFMLQKDPKAQRG